jgi:biopolymer transport protein TolQ
VPDLTIFQMIIDAGPMVKFVMLLLLIFSLVSWSIIIMKHLLFKRARSETTFFIDTFWKSKNLGDAYKTAKEIKHSPEAAIFMIGFNELQKIGRSKVMSKGPDETMEMRLAGMDNLKRALRKAEARQVIRFGKYLSFLATTGSATPFIGLFGTVWGIMTSFQEIGMRGSASLAVVAPGISEALVATAAGLAVAIPAVIFYNYYSNVLSNLENEMSGFSADFMNLVERDLLSRV